jgi:hypothetical protein
VAGRRIFVAGEILTAANVQSFLQDQVCMVFDDAAARTTAIPSPIQGMVTYLKDLDRLEVYSTAWGPVGSVLQVVSTTKTDTFSASLNANTKTAITGLSVSITPSSTSNKVYIMASVSAGNTTNNNPVYYTLKRGATEIGIGNAAGSRQRVTSGSFTETLFVGANSVTIDFLDTPNTTSATTYSVDISHGRSSTTTVNVNRSPGDSDSNIEPRFVSTITAIEVAG